MISLPFGYRVLLSKFTPGFDEYEAIFLYASDVFMVLFLIFFSANNFPSFMRLQRIKSNLAPDGNSPPSSLRSRVPGEFPTRSEIFRSLPAIFTRKRFFALILSVFLVFSGFSIFFASYKFLALYNFIRLVLLVLAALAIGEILRRNWIKLENILAVLAGSAVFQSLIAFFQFLNQKSLGLHFLGESVLGPGVPGVAKIVVAGGKILRAYGTFPHPNILAAFLLLGLFGSYYFLSGFGKEKRFLADLSVVLAVFIIGLGLVLTFSRTAWFLGLCLTLFYVFYLFKIYRYQAIYQALIIFFVILFLVLTMGWSIFPRAQISLAEPAVDLRISYDKMGWYLIKNHPLGIGLGNQVIYSAKNGIYQLLGMGQAWQWQPIHDIYLLIGSEIGVLGLIVFLLFLAKILIFNFKFFFSEQIGDSKYLEIVIITAMFMALLGFGLSDHFLWTLQPGRLMLWLVLGIMLGISPRS